MKVSRTQLKSLIKECLVEILAEGLGEGLNEVVSAPRQRGVVQPRQAKRRSQGRLDESKMPSMALQQAVKAEAGGDPILESILADTARTTLPSQIQASGPGGAAIPPSAALGKEERAVAAHDPDEIFGDEAASKWASLAFMPSKPMPGIPHQQ